MPRSRPWSASRSSWRSRGGGRSFASAAIAIAIAYAVALAYIAAVACIVAAPGLLMAGAAGAVAAADAEVAAYSAVVAYVVVEKRGPAAPFFSYAWMRSLPKSARVRVYLDDVRYERSINCNERMYISICRVPIPPPGCVRALIAVCSHALAHFLAASASDPVRNVPVG